MTAFLQFAPRYFEYMSKAFFHDVRSTNLYIDCV